MQGIYNKIYGDKVIWGVIISLALMSIPIVYVGTDQLAQLRGGNFFYFVIKHAIILLGAFVIAYHVSKIKHGYLSRLSLILMVITVPLLLYTMLAGHSVDSAERWIKIPIIRRQHYINTKHSLLICNSMIRCTMIIIGVVIVSISFRSYRYIL